MPWLKAGKGVALNLAGAILVGACLAGSYVFGLGLYAPPKGTIAQGSAQPPDDEVARNRVVLQLSREDIERAGTLSKLIEFYALDQDSRGCTIRETFGVEGSADRLRPYAERPLREGQQVVLCLD